MDENSEVHMETDVSSTTDDVLESQEVTASHGNVEMVIVVENVNEDSVSTVEEEDPPKVDDTVTSASLTDDITEPQASDRDTIPSSCSNVDSAVMQKSPLKISPQKISNVPMQCNLPSPAKKVANVASTNSTRKEMTEKVTGSDHPIKEFTPDVASSGSPAEESLPNQTSEKPIETADSTKTEPSPPKTINDKSIEFAPVKTSPDIKRIVLKAPLKVYRPPEKSLKEVMLEKTVPVCTNENITDEATKSPTKEVKKLSPTKELTKQSPTEEVTKLSPTKEATKPSSTKEAIKLSPTKEVTKLSSTKETTKLSPTKEATKPSSTKEATKLSPTKEVTKLSPTKETTKLSSTKEATKLSSTKEATKLSSAKEVTKLSPPKEATKLSIKESTIKTTNINGKVLSLNEKEDILDKTEDSLKHETSPMDIDKDSNSQASDTSEKEHNKSISRELKSLINSAKESKIISECNQLTSKTRKSRNPDTSQNTSVDADRIQGNRRGSDNSQISNCSEKSDKIVLKRSMRSQNPEFVSKCKQFLNAVTSKVMKDSDDPMSEDDQATTKEKEQEKSKPETNSAPSTPKRKKIDEAKEEKLNKLRSDPYCWRCHYIVEQEINEKAHPPVTCTVCPRSFHYKCLTGSERKVAPEKNWVCPDCLQILQAESSETRSPAMKKITLGMLCELLRYALERMMDLNGVEPFLNPVDRTSFPDYDKYVVHPMDLKQMKQNIADGHYGSTEAFVADAQWILHNSIIFNTCEQAFLQSKLTGGARALVRSCRAEMGEIEACPECYSGAHARRSTWFTDVCSTPHILLWAKLKGFPYWPAKGMTVNSSGLVDVRFFGAHDRAWVPAKDCFLYSEKDPNNFRSKRQDILDSMQEAEHHIRNISRKYGKFVYPPFKTQFDPAKMTEQLKIMIPTFEGEIKTAVKDKVHSPAASKDKRRSNSKSSKSSANEGDISECDDAKKSEADTSKDEINKSKNNNTNEKDKTIDMPTTPQQKDIEVIPSRKRRRSKLEEAVLTIIEPPAEKKRKTDDKSTENEQSCSKDDKTKDNKKKDEKLNKEVTQSIKKVTETKSKDKTPKDNEPSSSTSDQESQRVTPIKLVALPRTNKLTPKLFTTTKVSPKPSPKEDDKNKDPQKTKKAKLLDNEKVKRRNSRNRSSINATSTPKLDKTAEKKTDTDSNKEKEVKSKEGSSKKKDSDNNNANKSLSKAKPVTPSTKDRLHFDDDINLAVLARESRNSNTGLPTISSVRSLSTAASNTSTVSTKTTTNAKSAEVTEANSDSSIFTPTSTDNVRNMKDAVSKLQKLRNNAEPVVGRVSVKAFARTTEPNQSDDVQVEIKAEPIDLDEENEERQMEKMDLMNACKLRPVSQVQNPPQSQPQSQKAQSLRDVRINKVVVTPSAVTRKTRVEIRPRAKKTFPQPKRTEDGRSELNGKNSMVYIPIQPPITQAPVRGMRPGANAPNAGPRSTLPATSANSINTVTSPLRPTISTPPNNTSPPSLVNTTPLANVGSVNQAANVNQVSTVGQVPTVGPTTVHTVPLMTSVNGQWMFSLQPVMSLGGIDNTSASVNGVPERSPAAPPFVSLPNTPQTKTNETVTPVELPRLQQRPMLLNPLAENAPLGIVPTPSSAGPLTAKLNQNAVKLTDFFRNLLEDTIERVEEPVVQAHALKLQLEQLRWRHQQEIDELKHNHELSLAEMRTSLEKDKIRAVTEIRKTAQLELEAAVKAAKGKQWCANCSQEAQFYCCWNTSYCDYPCQRAHWPQHFTHCTQQREIDNEENTESRQQSQTDNLPKSAPIKTPALTVGGKSAHTSTATPAPLTRVYAQDSSQPSKTSIIVSMVEDSATGNQTMKCVGTYKSPQTPQNVAPLIINKQLLNEDSSAAKKVVTSGGYLIVGAASSSSSGNTPSVITPAPSASRRPHTIQYYT